MLRLMTGDLVLDEPDDFDMADLPALTRLVHWAGLLGMRRRIDVVEAIDAHRYPHSSRCWSTYVASCQRYRQ